MFVFVLGKFMIQVIVFLFFVCGNIVPLCGN